MINFSNKIGAFRELLDLTFKDFFKKFFSFLISLFIISLIEFGFLFLINHQLLKTFPKEFFKTEPPLLLLAGILVFFFSVWKFLVIVVLKEEAEKPALGKCLLKSLSATFLIIIPIILIGGINCAVLILTKNFFIFLITLLIYFFFLFPSYISLKEKRGGFEAFLRGIQILRRRTFQFYWKIVHFFLFLVLIFFIPGIIFFLSYFQKLPLSAVSNLTLMTISGLIIYFLFWMIYGSYLSILFQKNWENGKYLAFSLPNPLVMIAFQFFLTIVLVALILRLSF